MTEATGEKMLTFAEAAREVERVFGKRPGVGTLHRWAGKGVRGHRLRTTKAVGARFTTTRWLMEFFEASSSGIAAEARESRSPSRRKRELARAEAACAAAGL